MGDVSWNSLWAGSLFFTLDSKGISPPVPGASRGDNFDERSKRRIALFSLDVGSCVICLCARGGGVWSTEVGDGWSGFHVFSEMGPLDTGSTVGAHWGAGDVDAVGLTIWVRGVVCAAYLCRVAGIVPQPPVKWHSFSGPFTGGAHPRCEGRLQPAPPVPPR